MGPSGPAVICVSGAMVSIVQVWLAGVGPTLPVSRARRWVTPRALGQEKAILVPDDLFIRSCSRYPNKERARSAWRSQPPKERALVGGALSWEVGTDCFALQTYALFRTGGVAKVSVTAQPTQPLTARTTIATTTTTSAARTARATRRRRARLPKRLGRRTDLVAACSAGWRLPSSPSGVVASASIS